MSYLEQSAIGSNQYMYGRVAQCAASEGLEDPDYWTNQNRRKWSASPGWDTAWASAVETNKNNPTYDPGKDEAVITDGMILSEVQALIAAAQPTAG